MRALVVYESMFGNTKLIAEAIGEGLAAALDVTATDVSAAPTDITGDITILVVGGPTHAFGMSRATTRASAAEQAGSTATVTPVTVGLREWLASLPPASPTVAAAAFDTRIARPKLPGSAARKAAKRLRHLGYDLAAPAATFWVDGTKGPLAAGELERARRWGMDLAARCSASDGGSSSSMERSET